MYDTHRIIDVRSLQFDAGLMKSSQSLPDNGPEPRRFLNVCDHDIRSHLLQRVLLGTCSGSYILATSVTGNMFRFLYPSNGCYWEYVQVPLSHQRVWGNTNLAMKHHVTILP
jgi:hypothetical protein